MYVEESPENGRAVVRALVDIGFGLTDERISEIERCKGLAILKCGPFDLVLVFAPDGIEQFGDAWERHVEVERFSVCHPDDIIASKEASGRAMDRESLPRLKSFREYWLRNR